MPLINGTTILDVVPDKKKFLREKRKEIALQLSNGSTEPIIFINYQVEYDDTENLLFIHDKQTHYHGITSLGSPLVLKSMSLSQLYAFLKDYMEIFASSVEDEQTLEKNDGKWPVGEFVVLDTPMIEKTQIEIPFEAVEKQAITGMS
jgi:hypothetical protein